ncbi:MAG: bifunctional phosphopantothenoylcysteine decarboxylase/phosphopantothenate--cysteine ligase CoaBC [Candidatus Diapherotrites archaeon]|nr:bifunctional phosphopantothenoylcysteine decarboxylase/phosphopantothenate--cysteine ligase CoaBC [Candidatus Diapherotrites archaeon]
MKPFEFIYGNHSSSLKNKTIVLAVTGSIAAVKTVELARALIRFSANVVPVMSKSATEILHPNALEYACGQKPLTQITAQMDYLDLFGKNGRSDLLLICPATADCISKIAHAFSDDLISILALNALGSKKQILIVPAMHESMLENKLLQKNIVKLKKAGIVFLEPFIQEEIGKLPEKETIVLECERLLSVHSLKNKTVVIASGKTEEDVDDLRILTNRSSGKMGSELALQAYRLGAQVVVVACEPIPFTQIKQIRIRTAEEMEQALFQECKKANFLLMPAAIGDFDIRVVKQSGKISSKNKTVLELFPRAKIIAKLRKKFSKLFILGFKACAQESEIESICLEKLKKDQLTALVGNVGKTMMGADSGTVWLFKEKGSVKIQGTKKEIAQNIWSEILQ